MCDSSIIDRDCTDVHHHHHHHHHHDLYEEGGLCREEEKSGVNVWFLAAPSLLSPSIVIIMVMMTMTLMMITLMIRMITACRNHHSDDRIVFSNKHQLCLSQI